MSGLIVADALSEAAILRHGKRFHTRGGGVGRARSLVDAGHSLRSAARVASKQAKGHAAELRLSTELTTRSAVAGGRFLTQPNDVANDPHIDVEVTDVVRVNGAQVGVGKPGYLARKARLSLAPQVVINAEAREAMAETQADAYLLTSDRMRHSGVASDPVSEDQAVRDAVGAIERALGGFPVPSVVVSAGVAVAAGLGAGVINFGTAALFEVVERFVTGTPVDDTVIERALGSGARGFATTGLQTFSQVSWYLNRAGDQYRARLLHRAVSNAAWIGAVADFIVLTARDVASWLRSEISFDELLRRAGIAACSAAGAASAALVAARAVAGLPWWLQLIVVAGAGYGGGKLGDQLGRALFPPQLPAEA